ncbi:hypothetical protein [Heyndrickxia oleronia]|uniref:hypothetical protein n=1 Tax=Heyndrickxia oleronia TaxID=38875 RepID=UPI003F528419
MMQWGMDLGVKIAQGKTYIDMIKSIDNSPLNLQIGFKNLNFIELLSTSMYEPIKIDGNLISSFKSTFRDIEIPIPKGNNFSLKISHIPAASFKSNILVPFTSEYLENAEIHFFGKKIEEVVMKITHPLIRMTMNLKDNCFNFTINELTSVAQAKNIFNFLHSLFCVENSFTLDHPDFDEEPLLQFKLGPDNKDLLNDIKAISNLMNDLSSIESYYRVRFKDFNLNISHDEYESIQLLLLNITKEKRKINSIAFNINVFDEESLLKAIKNNKGAPVSIVYNQVTINLFNKDIVIPRKFVTEAPDAYFTDSKTLIRQIQRKKSIVGLKIKVKSKKNQLTQYFS